MLAKSSQLLLLLATPLHWKSSNPSQTAVQMRIAHIYCVSLHPNSLVLLSRFSSASTQVLKILNVTAKCTKHITPQKAAQYKKSQVKEALAHMSE